MKDLQLELDRITLSIRDLINRSDSLYNINQLEKLLEFARSLSLQAETND